MRSSSIKSVIATLTIVATLTLAVPALAAGRNPQPRPNRNGGSQIARIVRELIKRVGGITTNQGPSIPIGGPAAAPTTGTDTGGDTSADTSTTPTSGQ